MLSKIAVVGEKESVLGFKTVGFDVFGTASPEETESTIHRLAGEGYGIIFVTEQALQPVQHILQKYKEQKTPAIIPIPGRAGSLRLGMAGVHRSVERAVGADILFKE